MCIANIYVCLGLLNFDKTFKKRECNRMQIKTKKPARSLAKPVFWFQLKPDKHLKSIYKNRFNGLSPLQKHLHVYISRNREAKRKVLSNERKLVKYVWNKRSLLNRQRPEKWFHWFRITVVVFLKTGKNAKWSYFTYLFSEDTRSKNLLVQFDSKENVDLF